MFVDTSNSPAWFPLNILHLFQRLAKKWHASVAWGEKGRIGRTMVCQEPKTNDLESFQSCISNDSSGIPWEQRGGDPNEVLAELKALSKPGRRVGVTINATPPANLYTLPHLWTSLAVTGRICGHRWNPNFSKVEGVDAFRPCGPWSLVVRMTSFCGRHRREGTLQLYRELRHDELHTDRKSVV